MDYPTQMTATTQASPFTVEIIDLNEGIIEEEVFEALPNNLMPEFSQPLQTKVSLKHSISQSQGNDTSSGETETYVLGTLTDFEGDPISVEMTFDQSGPDLLGFIKPSFDEDGTV